MNTAARDVALVFAAGLAVRLYLIHRYPIVFGSDPIVRLAKGDHIVLAHQLPLLQMLLHYLRAWSTRLLPVQCLMAVVGAVAGVGFYLLMTNLVPTNVACDAALLFTTVPRILADSIVPNQEILMLAGMLFAFHYAFRERWGLASVSLGAACLTRYEAWLACPIIAAAYIRQAGLEPQTLTTAAALFGWAPLGWIAYNRGVTPRGSYAVEWTTNPERLLRWVHLGAVTVRGAGLPALFLAALGIVEFLRARLFTAQPYQMLLAMLPLLLIALLFSAHGMGEHPDRYVTEREAQIPLGAVAVLAGLGLGTLSHFQNETAVGSAILGLWMADRYVRRATADPHFALSYRVARYLTQHVAPGEVVAVLARMVEVEPYLARLERQRGLGPVRDVLRIVRSIGTTPPDYDRILVHSGLEKDRLLSYGSLSLGRFAGVGAPYFSSEPVQPVRRPQWVVVWSDFTPTNALEAELAGEVAARAPHEVFQQDGVWVRLYSLSS